MKTFHFDRIDRRRLVISSIVGGTAMLTTKQSLRAATETDQPATLLAQNSSSNVPMFRGDSAHTGVMAGPGPDAWNGVETIWKSVTEHRAVSPSVVDGVLYSGPLSLQVEQGGDWLDHLCAFDANDGTQLWHFNIVSFNSAPAVVDGVVYVGGYGKLFAIDAKDGTKRWHYGNEGNSFSSPTVVDGVVYVGSYGGNLYAIDAQDGTERWHYSTGVDHAFSSPAVIDGVLFAANNDGNLYAVDAQEGTERWRFKIGDEVSEYFDAGYFETTPAVADGVVYVGNDVGVLYAFDAKNGTEKWHFEAPVEYKYFISPAVADKVVYVGSNNGILYAIDANDGTERWQFKTRWGKASSPTIADGVVYVCMGDLYAVEAKSGSERWHLSGDGGSAPLVVANSMIYAGVSRGLWVFGAQIPQLSVGGTAQVTKKTTLRGGPSTTAVARAELDPDTNVTITDESTTTGDIVWWPVKVNQTGDQGWVEASKLEPLTSGTAA